MTNQPEALRVADETQRCFPKSGKKAARLLREQHAEIERLKAERNRFYMDYWDAARLLREQHAHIEDLISRNQGLAMQNSLLRATVEAMKVTRGE